MTQWTEDQKRVIESSARRIICSAAAGSGKTAVMIERIVRLIREGADPFSFLVITFTNAAAAEMKEKIRIRLLEERQNPVIRVAAEKAGAMEVCTIHAFCQHLIRQEFQTVGVDPFFQICSAAQREKLFDDAFRKACNELKKQGDRDYLSFTEQYEPSSAREMVREVYTFIMSLRDPFGWLREKTEYVPVNLEKDHPWFRTVNRICREKILALQVILRRQAEMFDEYEKVEAFRKVFLSDREKAEALRRWTEGREVTREELTADFARMPALRNLNDREIDWKERYSALRKELKEACGDLLSFILPDGEQTKKEFTAIRDSLRGLRKITEGTHRIFEQNKARYRVLDFADLEHKALAILREETCRAATQEHYQRIFVDECQDISSIQDALIGALAGEQNTLFMVGDVKQSIYRFRMANPKLFLDRLTDRNTEGQEVFFLRENFRSRPEVLETANKVFRDIMRAEAAELEYTAEHELRTGRKDCAGTAPVLADLLEQPGGRERLETVADHVAEEIRGLRNTKEFDYRDMVILMPEVSTDGPVLTQLLKDRGIPVLFDGRGDFFQRPEVEQFRLLLCLLENAHQDLPLLSVLVNPPFTFDEEELSRIRIGKSGRNIPFWMAFEEAAKKETTLGEKCRAALEKINEWRFLSEHMPLSDFVWFLMEESSYYAVFGATDTGLTAQQNLRSFCVQAEQARERGACSLREFLNQLTEQAASGETRSAPTLSEGDQVVRLMTIHKSKGLQFPVVFCLGLDKGLTGRPGGAVTLDAELGICLRYKVAGWRLSRKTAADRIFEWKKEHDLKAEKICLLYVAVTRAQERLYLVGTETDRLLWHMPAGDHRVLAASDYLDWIMPSLLDSEKVSTTFTQPSKHWKIRVFEENQQKSVETGKVIHSLRTWVDSLLSASPVEELWKTFSETKVESGAEEELKKTSVSRLIREARERVLSDEDEETPEEKRIPEEIRRSTPRYRNGIRLSFLPSEKAPDSAYRGTVIHRFLSLVDLDEIRRAGGENEAAVRAQRDRLEAEGVFTKEEASWIEPEKICRFFTSPVGRRMLNSPEIHREWDFNLCLRDRGMLIQGIMDCAFLEDGGWIVLDYKTDRIMDEDAFVEEYRPQLAWYTAALEQLTGKTVRESWLYSLSVDKAFPLRQQAVEG